MNPTKSVLKHAFLVAAAWNLADHINDEPEKERLENEFDALLTRLQELTGLDREDAIDYFMNWMRGEAVA